MLLLLFGRILTAGSGLVEAGAVFCFDLDSFSGASHVFAPEIYRILVASILSGLLNEGRSTEREPE